MASLKINKANLNTVLVNMAVFLGLLLIVEICLHLLFVYSENPLIQNYASVNQLERNRKIPQFSPHRYLGYYPTPDWKKGKNAHNALGFRGEEIFEPKPEETFRIVCIGGSTTYTSAVEDYHESYPYLLQQELIQRGIKGVEVINSGVGNWSSWESLINLQLRIMDLDPDLLIIYHSTNDIQSRIVWPPENYTGDNSGRRISTYADLAPGWKDVLFENSNILRILSIKLAWKTPNVVLERLDPSPETYHLPEFIRQLNDGSYPSGIFREVSLAKMLETNRPVYFRRNLTNMIDLAKNQGVGVVISTFAHCTGFENEFSDSPEYTLAYKEHNQIIKEIAIAKEIPCLDLANLFPANMEFYTDGRHVNEKGSRLKAKIFADFLTPIAKEN
ncbi:MAG: SGNH/GDSL hydrolase family protein [Roseivirga sp.]|nr:SGNH/GDSL hydrolase family protein [Roseivirga sp.]